MVGGSGGASPGKSPLREVRQVLRQDVSSPGQRYGPWRFLTGASAAVQAAAAGGWWGALVGLPVGLSGAPRGFCIYLPEK